MGTPARESLIHRISSIRQAFVPGSSHHCTTDRGRRKRTGSRETSKPAGRALVALIEPRRHRDGTKIVSGLSDMFSPAAGDASAARRHDGQLSESGRVAADFSACHSPNKIDRRALKLSQYCWRERRASLVALRRLCSLVVLYAAHRRVGTPGGAAQRRSTGHNIDTRTAIN